MKLFKFLLSILYCSIAFSLTSFAVKDKTNDIVQYGPQITVKNESSTTKDVAIVNDLDQIEAKVKVRAHASIRVQVDGYFSDYRVYYKETYEIEYQYRAGKDSYTDDFIIPSEY